jgi:hypothetical protein
MSLLAPTLQAFLSELGDYVELAARVPDVSGVRTICSA